MLRRGIERGELRTDFRMDLAVDWFAGLMILYAIIDRDVPSPDEAEELVEFMLQGIGPQRQGPTPV
jgi:hypothetical protein